MKKFSTIAVAMSALFFVSVSAKAQYASSRNMERRQSNNDQYDRNNGNDQYQDNDNGQYNQRNTRVNSPRPRVTIVIGANSRRGYDRPVDYRRYNDNRRYNDRRRYSRNNRYDRYNRNRGCESPRRYGY